MTPAMVIEMDGTDQCGILLCVSPAEMDVEVAHRIEEGAAVFVEFVDAVDGRDRLRAFGKVVELDRNGLTWVIVVRPTAWTDECPALGRQIEAQ